MLLFRFKSPIGKAVIMNNDPDYPEHQWDWFFTGFTLGQYGLGFVWRKRRLVKV